MKRKIIILLIIMTITILLTSCDRPSSSLNSYTIEKGKEVFISEEYHSYTSYEEIKLPDGVFFQSYLGDDTYLVYSVQNSSEENAVYRYGMANSGGLLVECEYSSVSKSGPFLNFLRVEESGESINEIRYIDGILLLKITGSVSIEAINDDYCTLYYDSYSQVFDKDGIYYFSENNKMSSNFSYSYCDGRLFGQDTLLNDWFIWSLSKTTGSDSTPKGIAMLDSFFTSDNDIKTVCYMGKDTYLIVDSVESDKSNFTYYEIKDNAQRFVYQDAYTINISTGYIELITLEYPILGVLNKYSPSMSYEQRNSFNVNDGFTSVCVAVLGEDLNRVGLRYYVMDSNCNFVIRYPEGITPGAISFIDGYGFAGMATASYGSGLFYMNCDSMWINQEHEYFDQSFLFGRYVCAYTGEGGSVYGAFDSDGNIVIPFEYDYLSPFSKLSAIAQKGDDFYIIDTNGVIERKLDDFYNDITPLSYGFYIYEEEGLLGIKNFEGEIIINADNDTYHSVEIHDGVLFVLFEKEEKSVLYRIY